MSGFVVQGLVIVLETHAAWTICGRKPPNQGEEHFGFLPIIRYSFPG